MRRKSVLLAICIGVVLLAALAIQHSTKAQRPGGAGGPPGGTGGRPGGPRGESMMLQLLPLETSWAYVCFELGVGDDALPKARKVYQESWGERKKLVKKAVEAAGDRDAMTALRSDAEKIKSDLAKKLTDILTPEQLKKLAEKEKEAQQLMQRFQGRQRRQQR